MRGEYSGLFALCGCPQGSPPLARGIHSYNQTYYRLLGITPACAGNTSRNFLYGHMSMDHPRLRGEYLSSILSLSLFVGSPPLARGIPHHSAAIHQRIGITPACAGNTSRKCCISRCVEGSPPLARGIQRQPMHDCVLRGITPACAGNTNRTLSGRLL